MTADARTVRLTIPAKAEYITLCRLALAGISRYRPVPDETLHDLKLALTEACTNSIRHAYDDVEGHVDVLYEIASETLAIEVTDAGEGFTPGREQAEPEEMSESGLGLAIIDSLSDEVVIEQLEGRGSRLRFVKRLNGDS